MQKLRASIIPLTNDCPELALTGKRLTTVRAGRRDTQSSAGVAPLIKWMMTILCVTFNKRQRTARFWCPSE